MAIDKVIEKVLERSTLEQGQKTALQSAFADAIRHELGGQRIYVNKNKRVEPTEVKRMFNGSNVDDVRQAFGISRARIYQIINEKV